MPARGRHRTVPEQPASVSYGFITNVPTGYDIASELDDNAVPFTTYPKKGMAGVYHVAGTG